MDRVTETYFAAFDLIVDGDDIYARPNVPDGQRIVELEGHIADDLAAATRAENHLRRCLRLCDGYRELVHHDIEVPEVLDTVWRTALVSYAEAFATDDGAGTRLSDELTATLGPASPAHTALLLQNDQYLRAHYGADSTKTFAVVADAPRHAREVLAVGAVEMPFGRSHAVDVRTLELLAARALAIAENRRRTSEHRVAVEVADDPVDTVCEMNELRFTLG
ncbi:hypothetical protein [Leifsonia shinshuensis]|uniref:Uncharacterized protein n=1 Tax=Leifsonia shinshuensis TaxID=150026 RepID=A0A7G6YBH3_9MICO|nr:hypothetical protein [Leifsonia shinshuensis]QNE35838.1 hypothetical protein F1C12_12350 [Leifsonia shinshuensis]